MKGIFREGGTAKPIISLLCQLTKQLLSYPSEEVYTQTDLAIWVNRAACFTMPGVACIATLRRFLLSKWHPLNVPLQFTSVLPPQLSSATPRLKLGNRASKLTARLEFEQEKVPGFQLHLHLFDNSYSQNTSDNNSCKSTGTARDRRFERADPGAIANQSTRLQPINSYWEKPLSCICVCVSATEH